MNGPVPNRVTGADKAALLDLVEIATDAGRSDGPSGPLRLSDRAAQRPGTRLKRPISCLGSSGQLVLSHLEPSVGKIGRYSLRAVSKDLEWASLNQVLCDGVGQLRVGVAQQLLPPTK